VHDESKAVVVVNVDLLGTRESRHDHITRLFQFEAAESLPHYWELLLVNHGQVGPKRKNSLSRLDSGRARAIICENSLEEALLVLLNAHIAHEIEQD